MGERWLETVGIVLAVAGGVAQAVFYTEVAVRSGTYSKKWWRGLGYSWWNDMDDKPTKRQP